MKAQTCNKRYIAIYYVKELLKCRCTYCKGMYIHGHCTFSEKIKSGCLLLIFICNLFLHANFSKHRGCFHLEPQNLKCTTQ